MKTLAKFLSILMLLALTNAFSMGMGYPMDMFAENGFEEVSKPKPQPLAQRVNLSDRHLTCYESTSTKVTYRKEKVKCTYKQEKAPHKTAAGVGYVEASLSFRLADVILQKLAITVEYFTNFNYRYRPYRTVLRAGWNMTTAFILSLK